MTNEDARSKGGRPPRHKGERLSKNRTFRIRADLDVELAKIAEASGRSVSEIIEQRLMHYEEQTLETARLREVVRSTLKSLEMLEELHRAREETSGDRIKVMQQYVDEMEAIQKDRAEEISRGELEQYGYRKILLDDGSFLWSAPGSEPAISINRLEAALIADKLSPILQRAVAEAVAKFQEEDRDEG